MTDVMEVDERFMHIATLDTVLKYMQVSLSMTGTWGTACGKGM